MRVVGGVRGMAWKARQPLPGGTRELAAAMPGRVPQASAAAAPAACGYLSYIRLWSTDFSRDTAPR